MTYISNKQTNKKGFRGKPRITLPNKLDEDLLILSKKKPEQLRDHGYNKILRLTNVKDVEIRHQPETYGKIWLKKIGVDAGEVDDSDESSTEADDYLCELFTF